VNQEYLELREMATANWLALAMDAPVQRLRAEGFRTGRDEDADQTAWDEVWQPNKLDARQRIPYTQMMVHGRGADERVAQRGRPEVAADRGRVGPPGPPRAGPGEPVRDAWASSRSRSPTQATRGAPVRQGTPPTIDVASSTTTPHWVRFEKRGMGSDDRISDARATGSSSRTRGNHGLGRVPFVAFDFNVDADGRPHSSLEPLIPAQDAITTIRFNTLLAMQFSAFRQRVFTGYDPVVRDDKGNVIWRKDADGDLVLDDNGQPIPIVASPGRMGVDRALVFPGDATKVFDLAESNLKNYIEVLSEFLTQFFATAQIPPQYLLTRMANLSGDALAGAESTLSALVTDLQTAAGESLESGHAAREPGPR
jgi:hypothetical protein